MCVDPVYVYVYIHKKTTYNKDNQEIVYHIKETDRLIEAEKYLITYSF